MRAEVTPKKLLGAFGRVAMAAASGGQKPQPQCLAAPVRLHVTPEGVAHQGRNWKPYPLGHQVQFLVHPFVEKERRSLHMTYVDIYQRPLSNRSG